MKTFHLTTSTDLYEYWRESLSYSCLKPVLHQTWLARALQDWYVPLLEAGYTNIPFFAVLDVGGRAMVNDAFDFTKPSPSQDLFASYTHALETFCNEAGIREAFAALGYSRDRKRGLALFLQRVLAPIAMEAPVLVAIEESVLKNFSALAAPPARNTVRKSRHDEIYKAFINAFTNGVHTGKKNSTNGREDSIPLLSLVDRRLLLGEIYKGAPTAALDLELVDRCVEMSEPVRLPEKEEERIFQVLQNLHLETPMTKNLRPEGGYTGIRDNGGMEDLGSTVFSELANSQTIVLDKITNRRLLVYERPMKTIRVRRILLNVILLYHENLLQVESETGTLPWREAKWLALALARDLARFMCRMRTIAVALQVHLVSRAGRNSNFERITLGKVTAEQAEKKSHFLLEQAEFFPWLFLSDLAETPVSRAEWRTLLKLKNIKNEYENVHCLALCAEAHYHEQRSLLINDMRDELDLSAAGIDSFAFAAFSAPAKNTNSSSQSRWRVEIVNAGESGEQREKDTSKQIAADIAEEDAAGFNRKDSHNLSAPLAALDLRQTIVNNVLRRILGKRAFVVRPSSVMPQLRVE